MCYTIIEHGDDKMKILKIEVEGLSLFDDKISIDFITEQNVRNPESGDITKLFSINNNETSVYINNILSYVGINAVGKTTILNIIYFVSNILNNKSLNSIKENRIISLFSEKSTIFTTHYFNEVENVIYQLVTYVKIEKNSINEKELIIEEEYLYSKKISSIRTKKEIFEINDEEKILTREGNDELSFLPNDVSMIISNNKKHKNEMLVIDTSIITNKNELVIFDDVETELISLIDSSIESVKADGKLEKYFVKFKGKDELTLNFLSPDIHNFLSSGTIKAFTLFKLAITVLKSGGYLIIDEIENHFNKAIVTNLIRLFEDKNVNTKGAVIVFSTHYIELLDILERNDSINVITKEDKIKIERFSSLNSRNDCNVSDLILSGALALTAPSYEKYLKFKKIVEGKVNEIR